MQTKMNLKFSELAFLFLFAAEFTFYLLILQTGIVEYHHSDMSQVWMVPFGGILGILLSVFLYKERKWFIPFVLLIQLLLSLNYANSNVFELFLFGLISGLTAPMLIARIDHFWIVVMALALSYTYGTYYFDIPALQRTNIALFLSAVALVSSLFANIELTKKTVLSLSLYSAGSIFVWLFLDASLFESLSRNSVMALWGDDAYRWNIILFHCIGLAAAYRAREWKYNDVMLFSLFFLTYLVYSSGWQWALSLVYPFVISYYNVIILRQLMRLPYVLLAVIALSLWGASGLGLLVALNDSFAIAWGVLLLLGMIQIQTAFPKISLKGFIHLLSLRMAFLSKNL